MVQPTEVIAEVLGLLEPMVASDGGALRMVEFAPERKALVVDHDTGVNDACATCVIDDESLRAFIEEGLRSRGLYLDEIVVQQRAGEEPGANGA